MKEIIIKNVNNITRHLENFHSNSEDFIYRGQSCFDWGLTPSIFRFLCKGKISDEKEIRDIISMERQIYDLYISHEYETFSKKEVFWEAICKGQHIGLPTRLLDWTYSVYVALYFACLSNKNDDGALFCINTINLKKAIGSDTAIDNFEHLSTNWIFNSANFLSSKLCEKIILFNADSIEEKRLKSQQGLFMTYLTNEDFVLNHEYHKLISNLEDQSNLKILYKFCIPVAYKNKISNELEKEYDMSVKHLFPDRFGLIQHVKYIYNKKIDYLLFQDEKIY